MIHYHLMSELERERHFGFALVEDSYPTEKEREIAMKTRIQCLTAP